MQNLARFWSTSKFGIGGRKNVHFSMENPCVRNEIWPRLLLITNRKWHTPCQIGWKSLTLDDLEGH